MIKNKMIKNKMIINFCHFIFYYKIEAYLNKFI